MRIHEDIEDFGTDEPRLGVVARFVLDNQIPARGGALVQPADGHRRDHPEHPINGLRDLGFAVTVNTDNRLMSGTSMGRECSRLANEGGWTQEDLFEATLTAAWSAFLPYEDRAELAQSVIEGFGLED